MINQKIAELNITVAKSLVELDTKYRQLNELAAKDDNIPVEDLEKYKVLKESMEKLISILGDIGTKFNNF